MRAICKIKKQITSFIQGKVKPAKFGFDFPDLVFDYEKELFQGDKGLFNAIDDLRMACALYNPDIPEGDENYVSLEKLKATAQTVYAKLVAATEGRKAA